jgi:hypothetical protein
LTYIDYPALLQQSNMTYAAMVNKAGNVVLPSYTTVQSAMDDFIQTVHDGVPTPPFLLFSLVLAAREPGLTSLPSRERRRSHC